MRVEGGIMSKQEVIRIAILKAYIDGQKMVFNVMPESPFKEGLLNGFNLVESFVKGVENNE